MPDAVAAATSITKDPVGSTHYGLTVDDTIDILWNVLENHRHDPALARTAGPNVASANAQLVAAAVTSSYVEVETGELDRRYYVADHLGSTRAVVNEQGHVLEACDYYPYGLTMPGRAYVQGQETREAFTGHELDVETGHYYAGARFYNPALARWMVVDPYADLYMAWSGYNYSLNNPIMIIDPDGMSVIAGTQEARQMILNSIPEEFKDRIQFNDEGLLIHSSIGEIRSDDLALNALRTLSASEN